MWAMKRVKWNYHTLQVQKTADSKLRKAIISKCNKKLVNCISECILNVLNGNIKMKFYVTPSYKNTRRRFAKSSKGACLSPPKRNS